MLGIYAKRQAHYANPMHIVQDIDLSPRLLIIEALDAAPQQAGGTLNIIRKIDTCVRDDGSGQ